MFRTRAPSADRRAESGARETERGECKTSRTVSTKKPHATSFVRSNSTPNSSTRVCILRRPNRPRKRHQTKKVGNVQPTVVQSGEGVQAGSFLRTSVERR